MRAHAALHDDAAAALLAPRPLGGGDPGPDRRGRARGRRSWWRRPGAGSPGLSVRSPTRSTTCSTASCHPPPAAVDWLDVDLPGLLHPCRGGRGVSRVAASPSPRSSGGIGGVEAQLLGGRGARPPPRRRGDRARRVGGAGPAGRRPTPTCWPRRVLSPGHLRAGRGRGAARHRRPRRGARPVRRLGARGGRRPRAALAALRRGRRARRRRASSARDYALGHALGTALPVAALGVASAWPAPPAAPAGSGCSTRPARGAAEDEAVAPPGRGGGTGPRWRRARRRPARAAAAAPRHRRTGPARSPASTTTATPRCAVSTPRRSRRSPRQEGVRCPTPSAPPATSRALVGTLGGRRGPLPRRVARGSTAPSRSTTLRRPDGTTPHVVYVPGTDDLATTPWPARTATCATWAPTSTSSPGEPTSYAARRAGGDAPGRDRARRAGAARGPLPGRDGGRRAGRRAHAVRHHARGDRRLPARPGRPPGRRADDLARERRRRGAAAPTASPTGPPTGHVTVDLRRRRRRAWSATTSYDRYVAGASAVDASADPSVAAAAGRPARRRLPRSGDRAPSCTPGLPGDPR